MNDLHPAPVEPVRDWDEPANREQLRHPSDEVAPFLDAVRDYAAGHHIEFEYALSVMIDSARMVTRHPPGWL